MANVVISYDSDVQKVLRDHERMIKKQEEQIDKYRKMAQASKRAEQEERKKQRRTINMMDRMKGQVGQMILGYTSLATATQLFGSAMQFSQEQSEKAVDSMLKLVDARRRLNQVTVSAADFDALDRRADELSAHHGVDRITTRDVLFASRSEKAITPDVVERIVKNQLVVDPYSQLKIAGQVPELFGGRVSADEALSGTLVAAGGSRADFQRLSTAMVKLSEGTTLAQMPSFAQTAATAQIMASEFETPDIAANRFKALASKLSTHERYGKGKDFFAQWELFAADTPESQKEFVGESQELKVARIKMLKNYEQLKVEEKKINDAIMVVRTGSGKSAMQMGYDRAYSPETEQGRRNIAMRYMQRKEYEQEAVNEALRGVDAATSKGLRSQFGTALQSSGASVFSQYAAQGAGWLGGLFTGDSPIGTGIGAGFGATMGGGGPTNQLPVAAMLSSILLDIRDSNERTAQAVSSHGSPSVRPQQLQEAAIAE